MSEIITDEMVKAAHTAYEDARQQWINRTGCGTGPLGYFAIRAALSAVATDIAAAAVERCASLGWLTPAKIAEIEAAEREASIAAISKRRDESISEDMTEVDVAYEAGLHDAINIIRARKG